MPQYKQSHLGLALYPSPHQGYRATFHLLLGIHSTTYIVYTVPYDRDVVVNCIKRHYDLLVRIAYLDPDVILHPPPGGWSDEQLAVDTLKERKRSERVIDLLRHMPYLSKNKDTVGKYEVYIETDVCTYLRNHGWFKDEYRDPYGLMMPWNSEQDSPAGFIPLSMGNAATVWMVDTDEGTADAQLASLNIDSFSRDNLAYGTVYCDSRCAGRSAMAGMRKASRHPGVLR